MNRRSLFNGLVGLFVLFAFSAGVSAAEKPDRGLIALEREDGSVFLSWRLLDTDTDDIAFRVKRRSFESAADTRPACLSYAGPSIPPGNYCSDDGLLLSCTVG